MRPFLASKQLLGGKDNHGYFARAMLQPPRRVMSKFSSLFLGGEHDPRPVFRDDAPDVRWPDGTVLPWLEGAAMAVTFDRKRFGHMADEIVRELPRTDFYGADGWPLDLPEERKSDLSELMKREFQVYPRDWRTWSAWTWRSARLFPATFARARAQAGLIATLVPTTSGLAAYRVP